MNNSTTSIFKRSAKICEPLDIEVKQPRICGRQIMRDNVEAESPEDYFRKSITVPFLYCKLRDRPINLQRGLCFFFSFRKICSDNTRVRIFFSQKLTLGYITKTLN